MTEPVGYVIARPSVADDRRLIADWDVDVHSDLIAASKSLQEAEAMVAQDGIPGDYAIYALMPVTAEGAAR